MSMLANKLRKFRGKGILPDEQTDFRRKMGSIDNVCFKFSGK